MRDFDIARKARLTKDRSFRLADTQFVYRASVAPEAYLRWNQIDPDNSDDTEMLGVIDDTVLAFLEPQCHGDWLRVRRPDAEFPVSLEDITALIEWLIEEQTDRPTDPQSGSSPGLRSIETPSTGGSFSPAAPAASET